MTQQPSAAPARCPACGSEDIRVVNAGPELDEGRQPVFACGTQGCPNCIAQRYTLTQAVAELARRECAESGHVPYAFTVGSPQADCRCGMMHWTGATRRS